jgi:hypothetical protein
VISQSLGWADDGELASRPYLAIPLQSGCDRIYEPYGRAHDRTAALRRPNLPTAAPLPPCLPQQRPRREGPRRSGSAARLRNPGPSAPPTAAASVFRAVVREREVAGAVSSPERTPILGQRRLRRRRSLEPRRSLSRSYSIAGPAERFALSGSSNGWQRAPPDPKPGERRPKRRPRSRRTTAPQDRDRRRQLPRRLQERSTPRRLPTARSSRS